MTIDAEILTVGDELLRGDVVDTNSAWLASRLGQLGLRVIRSSSIGDALEPLVRQLERAASRCQVLIVSGGLGPTDDDRTTEAVARLGLQLQLHEDVLEAMRQRFARAGYTLTKNNEKQAWVPAEATLLENEQGTAPGYLVRHGDCHIACLPGVPRELKAIFDGHLAPALERQFACRPALVRSIHTFGIGESQIDARLDGVLEQLDQRQGCEVSLHYRTSFPCNHVILVVRPGPETEPAAAAALLDRLEQAARAPMEKYVYGTDETTFSDAVVRRLRQAGATVALAESCTGGLAGDLVTSASGSSEVFSLGVVTYSNEAKHKLLGVPEQIFEEHGAVSQPCVEAMARGVRELADADYGVSISGIAGPTGGSKEKPVGTVHFALASAHGVRHMHRVFPFDRRRVKVVAAHAALALVLKELANDE